jgi:hypothetical protein
MAADALIMVFGPRKGWFACGVALPRASAARVTLAAGAS